MSIGSLQQLPLSCMLPSAQQIESLNNYTWLQIITILPCLTAIAIGKYCACTCRLNLAFFHYLVILIFLFYCFQLSLQRAKMCVSVCTLIARQCRREGETEPCMPEGKEQKRWKKMLRQEVMNSVCALLATSLTVSISLNPCVIVLSHTHLFPPFLNPYLPPSSSLPLTFSLTSSHPHSLTPSLAPPYIILELSPESSEHARSLRRKSTLFGTILYLLL